MVWGWLKATDRLESRRRNAGDRWVTKLTLGRSSYKQPLGWFVFGIILSQAECQRQRVSTERNLDILADMSLARNAPKVLLQTFTQTVDDSPHGDRVR
jgi:hypothetical protein